MKNRQNRAWVNMGGSVYIFAFSAYIFGFFEIF